ncbi:MAG TPA: glucose-1-phosphate adenylyltransferase, partial [bacterium]|nr:glucose-1-phosphate adenylyltransferase [bacterium]
MLVDAQRHGAQKIQDVLRKVSVAILGGGRGARLYPLTKERAKPAVPVAGKYRLIDIPLSNCIHSGLDRICILTQFNSDSLHRHITQTYRFDMFSKGFVQVLAAQQSMTNVDWYQGTADAVRQTFSRLVRPWVEHVLILSGDHLYIMDYQEMLATHVLSGADITVSVLPVPRERSVDFGIVQIDSEARVVDFFEKPSDEKLLDQLAVPDQVFLERGVDPKGRHHIGSMGVYLFTKEALRLALQEETRTDFGKHVFPTMLKSLKVVAHFFDGYWEDIGTVRSFYEANLDLTAHVPKFNFYSPSGPIFTHPRNLPAAKINGAGLRSSLVCEGAIITDASVEDSIIGLRSIICPHVQISRSIIMGADFYQEEGEIQGSDAPPLGIGPGSVIRGAIIDKNARIGANVRLTNDQGLKHLDR